MKHPTKAEYLWLARVIIERVGLSRVQWGTYSKVVRHTAEDENLDQVHRDTQAYFAAPRG